MNRGEKTAGHIMSAAGYKTAHFGKWHNGRTLGYEPWHFGFEDSWFPELYINLDNMMRCAVELGWMRLAVWVVTKLPD
jgi:arylsulfatase A-like enzyme